MIPEELARRIRYLQIFTTKAANDFLAGEYKSVFKGRGVEFDEFREYQPGDDVRAIDWNVTARYEKPFVKRFREERELTIMFLVDLSASAKFGTVRELKVDAAAELCALLAFSAVKNNDKIGLIAFTDRIEKAVFPGKRVGHALRLIREILCLKPRRTKTDIAVSLNYLGHILPKRALVFLISDFQAEEFRKPLRIMARRHDLIAVTITDPSELSLPDVGLVEFVDPETGRTALVDTGCRKIREGYERKRRDFYAELNRFFRSAGVDQLAISTARPIASDLKTFFKHRREKRRS